MRDLYNIKIEIYNKNGTILDTQMAFEDMDTMALRLQDDIFNIIDKAHDYAKENNLLLVPDSYDGELGQKVEDYDASIPY